MQRMKQMRLDPELVAMNRVSEVMKYLGNGQKRRVIAWTKSRFNLIDEPPVEASTATEAATKAPAEIPNMGATGATPEAGPPIPTIESTTQPIPPAPTLPTQPIQPTEPAQPTQQPQPAQFSKPVTSSYDETIQKPGVPRTQKTRKKIFANFDTIEDLFLMVNAKKVSHRILLVAAYLQEKGNADEVSSLDINSSLKRLGYGVSNITTLINGLLKKIPPQIVVTKKEGDTKQSRRKFRVTERGFKDAQSFIVDNEE